MKTLTESMRETINLLEKHNCPCGEGECDCPKDCPDCNCHKESIEEDSNSDKRIQQLAADLIKEKGLEWAYKYAWDLCNDVNTRDEDTLALFNLLSAMKEKNVTDPFRMSRVPYNPD